jgi:hypothetical protein
LRLQQIGGIHSGDNLGVRFNGYLCQRITELSIQYH